jgi:hypothetical protein
MTRDEMGSVARKTFMTMQIDGALPVEKYEILIKPGYGSANWRFYEGRHIIVLGSDIFDQMTSTEARQSFENKSMYMNACLKHEFAHSIWTERDIVKTNEILQKESLSFVLFNLFEDARIEEKMRQHINRPFRWFAFEEHDIPETPVAMFFYLLQCEHNHQEMRKLYSLLEAKRQAVLNKVFVYYKEILGVTESMSLINIMKRWMKDFPTTETDLEAFGTDRDLSIDTDGDLNDLDLDDIETLNWFTSRYLFANEAEFLRSPEFFSELIKGLEDVLQEKEVYKSKGKPALFKPRILSDKSSNLLMPEPVKMPFDEKKAALLFKQIEKLFQSESKYASTAIPSNRINVKRAARGDKKIYRRRERIKQEKKRITILLDLSGSMSMTIPDMRLLVEVINRLVLKGVVDCTLILSADMAVSEFQVLQMPLHTGELERIDAHDGGEGLANTIEQNFALLKNSDYVWVFTDGFIGGGLKSKYHYQRRGVNMHAMYIGQNDGLLSDMMSDVEQQMKQWFDHVICKSGVEGLAEEVFTLVKC